MPKKPAWNMASRNKRRCIHLLLRNFAPFQHGQFQRRVRAFTQIVKPRAHVEFLAIGPDDGDVERHAK